MLTPKTLFLVYPELKFNWAFVFLFANLVTVGESTKQVDHIIQAFEIHARKFPLCYLLGWSWKVFKLRSDIIRFPFWKYYSGSTEDDLERGKLVARTLI